MNPSAKHEVIGITDVVKRVPGVAKKLPHILDGLRQVYLRKATTPRAWHGLLKKQYKKILPAQHFYMKTKNFPTMP